jgi:hypothetical protein
VECDAVRRAGSVHATLDWSISTNETDRRVQNSFTMAATALRRFDELWSQESFDAVYVHADSAKEDLKSIRHLFSV